MLCLPPPPSPATTDLFSVCLVLPAHRFHITIVGSPCQFLTDWSPYCLARKRTLRENQWKLEGLRQQQQKDKKKETLGPVSVVECYEK